MLSATDMDFIVVSPYWYWFNRGSPTDEQYAVRACYEPCVTWK